MADQSTLQLTGLGLVVAAGFLGSFHCAAMCGPFVGFTGMRGGWRRQLAYQGGRLASYLALGSAAGLLGAGLLHAAATVQLQKGLTVLMGLFMIGTGLLAFWPGAAERGLPRLPIHRWLGPLRRSGGPVAGAAMTGLCSALLPCGFLYGFVLAAAAAGHPIKSILVMFAFWAGTLPALASVGLIARLGSRGLQQRLARLTPVLLIVLGLLAVSGKWTAIPEHPNEGPLCHDVVPAAELPRPSQ